MKTPQVKPNWPTGIYNGRTVMVPDEPQIIDDGTLDTVVEFLGVNYRFSTEYRQEFENDAEFLSAALDQIYENIQ
jgi:hypothetical protein